MDAKGDKLSPVLLPLPDDGTYAYVAVKGSLHAGDSAVFGLGKEEVSAIVKRFPGTDMNIINGINVKAAPMSVINALGQLGYKVISTTGEAEITWTLQRELMSEGDCHCHASVTSVTQTLDEMDWERGIWNAALSNDVDRVQNLLSKRVDPGVLDNSGYTALHYAARAGNIAICQLLLEYGAPVNALTRAGRATALHRAAAAGKIVVVRLLLSAGASVLLQDADGQTALHRAAENCHEGIVEEILKNTTNIKSICDNKGRKPIECVPIHANKTLFNILN